MGEGGGRVARHDRGNLDRLLCWHFLPPKSPGLCLPRVDHDPGQMLRLGEGCAHKTFFIVWTL